MSPSPTLRLVCHRPSRPEHTPLHVDSGRAQLWELLDDGDAPQLLKASGLLELARRRDSAILDYCQKLLISGSSEEWLLAVKAIAAVNTRESIQKLVMLYASSLDEDRRYIANLVARTLTVENVHPFSIMVRELAVPGELDITGWTSTAVATLQDVCRRQGIETTTHGISKKSDSRMVDIDEDPPSLIR